MSIPTLPKAALSVTIIGELGALLELRAVPFKGMSLEMLDGYLCSLNVGPFTVPPEEWMPRVWGGWPPRWESQEEANHVNDLLMALCNDVKRRVAIEPEVMLERDTPLIALPDKPDGDAPYAADWAFGFIEGVKQCTDGWGAWCAKDTWIDSALVGIETLASGEWMSIEAGKPADPLSTSDRFELIGNIPYVLHDFNMHRFEQSVSSTPIRREAAPGRNDPCPCGSGKKFKQCCGR
jgi:uncharacterized protein